MSSPCCGRIPPSCHDPGFYCLISSFISKPCPCVSLLAFQFPLCVFPLSVAVSQFRVCILRRPHVKANYITTLSEGCPNSKAPPNATHKCGCPTTILRGLTYTRFFCAPVRERKNYSCCAVMGQVRAIFSKFRQF